MAKKGIVFNETEYLTLNDLGNAFAQNFELAINFVMDNTKKFIKFIRKIDKSKAKEVADIITTCKYQNNVITFIIYLFCDDKKVVINGQELTFKAFIKAPTVTKFKGEIETENPSDVTSVLIGTKPSEIVIENNKVIFNITTAGEGNTEIKIEMKDASKFKRVTVYKELTVSF